MNAKISIFVICVEAIIYLLLYSLYDLPLLPFELLFRDVKQENLCSEDLFPMKARILEIDFSLYESFYSD